MIINRFEIINGLFDKSDDIYSEKSNLFLSKKNSVGKSTYLRLMFYALGYQIPSMYGLDFEKLETKIIIEEKGKKYILIREPKNLIVFTNEIKTNYSLPNEHISFLSKLFSIDNVFVLTNLLGTMYVDQEKGWTLLNRGIVIGKNRFDIDKLLMGLGNIDCKEQLVLKEKLEKENKKYKSIIDINNLKNEILEENDEISFDNYEQDLKRKIDFTNLQIQKLKQDITNIDKVLDKNESLFKYITNLHLVVEDKNGDEIPVNIETLRNASENKEFLKNRKFFLSIELGKKENELILYEKELKDYYLNNNEISKLFGNDFSTNNTFLIKSIANLNINLTEINSIISQNNKQILELREIIEEKILGKTSLINKIFSRVLTYCSELGISSKIINNSNFLYTDKLKWYSGTDFHKLVIAFKVALHISIEEYLNTKIPFVVDSPSGRELDASNIELTVNFIRTKLEGSQLFFASINDYKCDKTFYFKQYAIENHNTSSE